MIPLPGASYHFDQELPIHNLPNVCASLHVSHLNEDQIRFIFTKAESLGYRPDAYFYDNQKASGAVQREKWLVFSSKDNEKKRLDPTIFFEGYPETQSVKLHQWQWITSIINLLRKTGNKNL